MGKPWARLEQNYINHPKFLVLNAAAICLWHEGKNYCDMHHTDGMIPKVALQTFRFSSRHSIVSLTLSAGDKPNGEAYAPLWEAFGVVGFKMHDYLDHNDCRDEVLARIAQAELLRVADKERKRVAREAKRAKHEAERLARVRDLSDRTNRGNPVGQPEDSPRTVQDLSHSIHQQKQKHNKQEPRAADDDEPMEQVATAFRAGWKQVYGYECSLVLNAVESVHLEQQATRYGAAQLQLALAAYFAAEDAFLQKAKHPLSLFLRDPLKYLASTPSPGRPARCKHDPPCADDVMHTRRDMDERRHA